MAGGRRLDKIFLHSAAANHPSERRDHTARRALVNRVLSEYKELPGMCLTVAQASRLFAIPPGISARILGQLVENGVLKLTSDGRYRLPSDAA